MFALSLGERLVFATKLLICLWFAHKMISSAHALVLEPSGSASQYGKPTSVHLTKVSEDIGIGVGIDLGTTNSAIAYLDPNNEPKIIEIPNNGRTMKSVVAFDRQTPLVGSDALEWERRERKSAYRHVKRVIGTGASYLSGDTAEVVPHLVPSVQRRGGHRNKSKQPTLGKLLEDATVNPTMLYSLELVDGKYQTISPEAISSAVLEKLLDAAREHTGKEISRAVVGVPAYFNDAQREATIRAAKQAGIEKVKLLREPEAAALAYGVEKGDEEELVLVFDLGGGTYDVSVLLVERGLTEVVCTSGNTQLGGSDFDARIAKQIFSWTGNCCKSALAHDVVIRTAEAVRIYLSNNKQINLALPTTDDGWMELNGHIDSVILPQEPAGFETESQNSTHAFLSWSRKEMEQLCYDELTNLLRPIREVAIMAGALLPGDTRPTVVESAIEMQSALEDHFYVEQAETEDTPPREEIDFKAAKKRQQKGRKKARQLAKDEKQFRSEARKALDVEPAARVRPDGISGRPLGRVVLVGGATRMPAIGRLISALTGVVPQKTVDPDEAVALGCAVHVGVLDGKAELGTVLNPMQAAILRAVVEKQRRDGELDDMIYDDDYDDDVNNLEFGYGGI